MAKLRSEAAATLSSSAWARNDRPKLNPTIISINAIFFIGSILSPVWSKLVKDIKLHTLDLGILLGTPQTFCCEPGQLVLHTHDHDFRGLDKRRRDLALLQLHLVHCVRGDDGSDMLTGDVQRYLREEAAGLNAHHSSHELVASADAPEVAAQLTRLLVLMAGTGQKTVEFAFGDAVVTAYCLHGAQFLLVDPKLQGWIADSQHPRDLAGLQHLFFFCHKRFH